MVFEYNTDGHKSRVRLLNCKRWSLDPYGGQNEKLSHSRPAYSLQIEPYESHAKLRGRPARGGLLIWRSKLGPVVVSLWRSKLVCGFLMEVKVRAS